MSRKISYWEYQSYFENLEVVIVGAGIVGISTAYYLSLKYPNKRILVVESSGIPRGASTRNAGFACFGSITEIMDDLELMPEDFVMDLIQKRYLGLQNLQKEFGVDFLEMKMSGGYELFTDDEEAIFQQAHSQIKILNEKIYKQTGLTEVFEVENESQKFGFKRIKHVIKNNYEGVLNPMKILQGYELKLKDRPNVQILKGMPVKDFEDHSNGVHLQLSNGWNISTKDLILATNGFTKHFYPNLDIHPARNQIILTAPIKDLALEGSFHYNKGYYYFRQVGQRVLLGGARVIDQDREQTEKFALTDVIQDELKSFLYQHINVGPETAIDMQWSGIMGLGAKKKPIVERVSDHVILAVRLGGMGIAIGSLIGQEAANIIN